MARAGQREFDDDQVARLRIALARISRLVDRTAADAGFTRTQLSVLGAIVRFEGENGEGAGLGELAEFEGLNPTMLSRVVGKLEAAGLIVKAAVQSDRRAALVRATAAGRELHLRLRARRTELLIQQLDELPGDRAHELLVALPALEALAEQLHRSGSARQPVAGR
jgi:DNA-binding MarR family transcriptional regulator